MAFQCQLGPSQGGGQGQVPGCYVRTQDAIPWTVQLTLKPPMQCGPLSLLLGEEAGVPRGLRSTQGHQVSRSQGKGRKLRLSISGAGLQSLAVRFPG